MTVKAIIFDFWGTLVELGTYSPLRQAQKILRIRMPFSKYVVQFEEALMKKKFDSLQDAFEETSKAFGLRPHPKSVEILVGLWNKNRLLAKPFPEAIEMLEELKKKYKLALISNSDCFSIDPLLEKFDMKKFFDSIVLSYEEGMLKSDAKMFDKVLNDLKLKKEEVIMVGDSMESDIRGAENAGIKPVLVDRRDRRDYSIKVINLRELRGVLDTLS